MTLNPIDKETLSAGPSADGLADGLANGLADGSADLMPDWLTDAFFALIVERTGLDFRGKDRVAIGRKIVKRAIALGHSFPEHYYQQLSEQTPQSYREWRNLSQLLTNGESFFFRDKGQFSALAHHVLPALIQRNAKSKTLRLCSAGCSTGEEVYSLAILLESLIPDLDQWDVKVYGLDINPASVAKAKAGVYRSWSLRGMDPARRQAHFQKKKDLYHISGRFKSLVDFHVLNLVSDPFVVLGQVETVTEGLGENLLAELDLIICRNVFIYFTEQAIAQVLTQFYQALSPLGYLVAGHSELYGQDLSAFDIQTLPNSLVFQRPAVAQVAPLALPFEQAAVSEILNPSRRSKATVTKQLQLAQNALQNKTYTRALHYVEKALALQPDSPKALCLMAQIHADAGQPAQAIDCCQKAIKSDSCFTSPYFTLAKIFAAQGDLGAAKRTLKKIIYLEPTAVVAYMELSQIYQEEGNVKKSELMRRSAFEIFNQHLSPPETVHPPTPPSP